PERELHVHAAELSREAAVLVLGIDDVDLDAATERAERESREQVGLSRPGVAEDRDVRVRVPGRVERVDRDRRAARLVAADDKTVRLAHLGIAPRKEGDERGGVEHPAPPEAVEPER